jgi:hypothetical protein
MATRFLGVMAVMALAGCAGSGGGVPVKVQATKSGLAAGGPITVQDQGGASVVIEEARLAVKEIRLKLPDGTSCADVESDLAGGAVCEAEDSSKADDHPRDEIRVKGPFVVDLLAGTSTPDVSDVRVPDLAYAEARIRLTESDQLGGATFVVKGTADGQPLSVSLRIEDDIEIQKPGGVRAVAGAPLLVEFDTSAWFAALSFGSCTGDLTVDDSGQDSCELETELEHSLGDSADIEREDESGDDKGGHGGDDRGGDDSK